MWGINKPQTVEPEKSVMERSASPLTVSDGQIGTQTVTAIVRGQNKRTHTHANTMVITASVYTGSDKTRGAWRAETQVAH